MMKKMMMMMIMTMMTMMMMMYSYCDMTLAEGQPMRANRAIMF